MKSRMKIFVGILLAIKLMILPVMASSDISAFAEARYNNVVAASLSLGFDKNNVAYCSITLSPYAHCTGLEGYMRLLDSNGDHIASWNVYDYTEPYMIEKTHQVEYGKTYTLTFQGYAYGEGKLFDDIVLSVTATCTD